ncbi:response regulator [Pararhodospirillum photometricum]|uniref:Sensor protein n=1 Tax=Pararhodospirillum photometricum DSM 122 TaxID=1150469 RepID=H6SMW3_PARPM|nr:response regulator [Pararhodospirillum photometricum]CCG09248.1 Sensor protein [Pararhodospirillum photometricum DSM 122]
MTHRDWPSLIRRFRQENDLTQSDLATFLGVSQKSVSRWERGADKPNEEIRRRLTLLLGEEKGRVLAGVWDFVRHAALPLALVDDRGHVLVASRSYPVRDPGEVSPHKPPTVLVVEDDEAVLKATQAVLRRWHCLPVGVEGGEAALRLLAEGGIEPRVAIVDFLLPGPLDGVDLARLLRERWPLISVLIVSGESTAERMYKIADSGLPFLAKPVDPEEMRLYLTPLLPLSP